jgi:hypothetical protein
MNLRVHTWIDRQASSTGNAPHRAILDFVKKQSLWVAEDLLL